MKPQGQICCRGRPTCNFGQYSVWKISLNKGNFLPRGWQHTKSHQCHQTSQDAWLLMPWDGRCSSLPYWCGTEDVTSSHPLWPRACCTSREEARKATQAALRSQHCSAEPCAWAEEAALVSVTPPASAHSHSHHLHPTQASCTSALDSDTVRAQTLLPSTAGRGWGRPMRMAALNHEVRWAMQRQEGAELLKRSAKLARDILGLWTFCITYSLQLGLMPLPNLEHRGAFGHSFIQKHCLVRYLDKMGTDQVRSVSMSSQGQLMLMQNIGVWFATKVSSTTYTCDGAERTSPAGACMRDD